MNAEPEEERVLLSDFERVLDAPSLQTALDEMVAMDVKADLREIRQPLPQTSLSPEAIEDLFVNSAILKQVGATFERAENRTWHLQYKKRTYAKTFYPDIFKKNAFIQYMSFGKPLFEKLLGRFKEQIFGLPEFYSSGQSI